MPALRGFRGAFRANIASTISSPLSPARRTTLSSVTMLDISSSCSATNHWRTFWADPGPRHNAHPATDLHARDAAAYACRPNVIRRGYQETRANELRWDTVGLGGGA